MNFKKILIPASFAVTGLVANSFVTSPLISEKKVSVASDKKPFMSHDTSIALAALVLAGINRKDLTKSLTEQSNNLTQEYIQKAFKELESGARPEEYAEMVKYINMGFRPKMMTDLYKMVYFSKEVDTGENSFEDLLAEMLNVGSDDYSGMVKLIKAYDGTECLSLYHAKNFVAVKNGDFTGAAEYVNLARKAGLNEKYFDKLLSEKDISFKTVAECLNFINDNDLNLSDYSNWHLLRDEKWKENVAKIEYLKTQGVNNLEYLHECFCDNFKTNTLFSDFKQKYETIDSYVKEDLNNRLLGPLVEKKFVALAANSELSNERVKEVIEVAKKGNLEAAKTVVLMLKMTKLHNELFEQLYKNKDFPQEYIANIIKVTNNENYELALQLCKDKNFPKEYVADIIRVVKDANKDLALMLINNKNLPKEKVAQIIESTKINDLNDNGGNKGRIDEKRVDKYIRLFKNSYLNNWVIKMLKLGFDIETISNLSQTKQTFYANSARSQMSRDNSIKDEMAGFFASLGFNEKESNAVFKVILHNNIVDSELKDKAVELTNLGVAKNKIGDILNSAKITGEFNSKIVDDFILLQNKGLNPLLEKNLAVLNNISGADCATKFNSKVRNQMKAMINNLPDAVKNSLTEQGIEIDSILKKLDSQIVRTSANIPTRAKVESGFRSKAKITGFERIVIDRYEPTEQVWRNEEATKKWAEEKYTEFKNIEYVSTRNTTEDPQLGEKVTQKRKEMLQEWYDFMDTDENIKNNPFEKLILCDFITKELEPERSTTPPVLDKAVVKQILGDAANSSNFSISNAYAKKMKELSAKNSSGQQIEINGRKGTWYTVPKTDSSSPDFKTNLEKVRAFSYGTNWCIRTRKAESYLPKGDFHFFVDENGLTQICLREQDAPKSVYEVQKRQQDQKAPVAYLDVIQAYINEHGLNPQKHCREQIEEANAKKFEYNKLRSELEELFYKNDYKKIFEKMGISVETLRDGSFELSRYSSYIGAISLNEFGINENELLANVSRIVGRADFTDSNASKLPLLEYVGGKLNFGYANISNLKNLKSINGKQICWES